MTRCGDRRCTVPSHRNQAHPAWLTEAPVYPPREWERTDPGYDQPGPPRRSDLSWAMVVQAFVVFVAIVMFCVLASLVEVGS